METDLKGKKLLILGANPETIPFVQVANDMGVKTFVTSNRADDPAKKYAYRSCEVDGMDVDGLVDLVRKEQIDGVMVGVADILVPIYAKVCKKLNLPCYATEEICNIFSYKDKFKQTCEKYGIHGIPEYHLDETFAESDLAKIKYPVMVKPTDGYSGLGMTVCYDETQLRPAVAKALNFSKCKKFIVERYMQCEDMGLYYTFKDGVCSASCIYDRYTTNEQVGLSKVCLGGTYPSKHIDVYFKKMHQNAVKMFDDIGIKNGVLMLSAFYEDETFYVYDTGFRLQGEAPHLLMNAVHGFDQREMLVRFALTGSEGNFDLMQADDARFRGKWAATLWFLLKEGTIDKIEGLQNVNEDNRIVANVQRLYEGDKILSDWIGTEKQVLTRLYIVCNTKFELAKSLQEYMDKVKVYDKNNNNLLLKGFDVKQALMI